MKKMRYVFVYKADGGYFRYPIANACGKISTSERVALNKKCGFEFEDVNICRYGVTDVDGTDIDEVLKNFCSRSKMVSFMDNEELACLKKNQLASFLCGSTIYGDVWFFQKVENGQLIAY